MKCYKRLTYKQFVQVSGLCGPQFLSCLLKCFTHLCRALYVDAILVYHLSVPIWPPKINKNIWSSRGGSRIFFRRGCTHLLLYFNTNKPNSFFGRIPVVLENRRSSQGGGAHPLHPSPRSAPEFTVSKKALSFHSRTSIRVHKHIF